MSTAKEQGFEDFDYAALCATIESLAAEYERLPHVSLTEMRPSPESRKLLKALNVAVSALDDRAEAELPPGFDLRPVVLVRRALGALHTLTLGGYYSPFRGRADASPASVRAYAASRTVMEEAVRIARHLRDHGPDRPRVDRLVAAVGPRRALESLAKDLDDLLVLIEPELSDEARAEIRTAASLLSRNAPSVAR